MLGSLPSRTVQEGYKYVVGEFVHNEQLDRHQLISEGNGSFGLFLIA